MTRSPGQPPPSLLGDLPDPVLVALVRALPPPSLGGAHAVRQRLLAAADAGGGPQRSWRTWAAAATVLCVAGAGGLAWLGRSPGVTPHLESMRGAIQAAEGARFSHQRTETAGLANEVVWLRDGRVTVDVRPLSATDRFRVVTGDAEIEVRGTRFEVVTENDQLRAVLVHSGRVHVRPWQGPADELTAGQRWSPAPRAPVPAVPALPDAVTGPPAMAGVEPAQPVAPPEAAAVAPAAVLAKSLRQGVAQDGSKPLDPLPNVAGAKTRGPGRPVALPPAAGTDPASIPTAAPAPASVQPTLPPSAPPSAADVQPPRSLADEAWSLGWSAIRRKDFDVAAQAMADVLRHADDGPLAEDARYWRAVALSRVQRSVDAKAAWRTFLARHPKARQVGEARAMLGWLLLEAGDAQAALVQFEAALGDTSPAVRASAGSGREAARQRLERAVP